jgi:phospholipase C
VPYELYVQSRIKSSRKNSTVANIELQFSNTGTAAAVFHVYDRLNLDTIPRRFTVEPNKKLTGSWNFTGSGEYDLWVIDPNGFHRYFTGYTLQALA